MSSVAAPDKGRQGTWWVRNAKVTTWVKLAAGLGRDYTAEALYDFFTSCELITTNLT